jgi:hypothetical protein
MDDQQVHYLVTKLWKKYFWHVHIKEWIPFAKCDHCTSMLAAILSAKSDEERAQVKEERKIHRDRCSAFRKYHNVRMELGLQQPDRFLSLIIDGMDNQKTMVPRLEGPLQSKLLHNEGESVCAISLIFFPLSEGNAMSCADIIVYGYCAHASMLFCFLNRFDLC